MLKTTYPPIFLVIIVTVTTLTLFHFSEGLECYSCWSEHSFAPEKYKDIPSFGVLGHGSCVKGKIPDASLKEPCLTTMNSEGKALQPVCVQIFMNLTYRRPTPVDYQIAYRGCFYANTSVEDLTKRSSCSQRSLKELERLAGGPMQSILASSFNQFPTNMTTQFCHCSEDNCNAHFLAEEERDPNSEIPAELGNSVLVTDVGVLLSPSLWVTMMTSLIMLPFAFN